MSSRPCVADTVPPRLRRTLSQRDVDVLRLLAEGRSTRQISESLSVSSNTARTRIRRIQAKLEVSDRTAAVRAAGDLRLLQFPHPWRPLAC